MLYIKPLASCRSPTSLKRPDRSKQCHCLQFSKPENVYRFLMFTSKEQILALKPVYTGNPLSPASIYVESPLVLSNIK